MGLGSNCFSSNLVESTVENAAENVQGKNQFARFRILQTEEGEHVYIIYSLVMLTFRSNTKCIKNLVTQSTAGVI